jgi:hypothetical protein
MLNSIKRLIVRPTGAERWLDLHKWARSQHMAFKTVKDAEGFWIEGGLQSRPWRLEWGTPQREYIDGHELRMRMELGVSPELQMMVLSKSLFEALEHTAFERFTQTTQTMIDDSTPEEMRWLVMFPAASYQASKAVQSQFHLVGRSPLEAAFWMESELSRHLEAVSKNLLKHAPAFLLMVLRSRMYLRMQLNEPGIEPISQAVAIFETAVLQALRTANLAAEGIGQGPSSTAPTAWRTQFGRDQ